MKIVHLLYRDNQLLERFRPWRAVVFRRCMMQCCNIVSTTDLGWLLSCSVVSIVANRIGIAQPSPIALPRITDRGEIKLHEPLEYLPQLPTTCETFRRLIVPRPLSRNCGEFIVTLISMHTNTLQVECGGIIAVYLFKS